MNIQRMEVLTFLSEGRERPMHLKRVAPPSAAGMDAGSEIRQLRTPNRLMLLP